MRSLMEHVGDLGAEPGEVDYIEVDCNGVPGMGQYPNTRAIGTFFYVRMAEDISLVQCTRTVRCSGISQRRQAAAH